MVIADYELYERLKPKLGEEETRALLERFDRLERELPERIRREAATKEDLLRLEVATKAELQQLKAAIDSLRLEAATKVELQELRGEFRELREEFLKFKVELLERMHGLERRMDRFLYTVILLFFIFNGDKVLGLMQGLLRLTGR